MEVTRVYKNASEESLRVDTIYMIPAHGCGSRIQTEHTYKRQLSTQLLHTETDREVSDIDIYTDADTIPFDPSGGNNYSYVEWTERSRTVRCNMTDLPVIGDTV